MVLLTLLMYPVFFGYYHHINAPLKEHVWGHYLFSASLFVLATCSASTFFVFAQRELLGKLAGWKTLMYLPVLMALGVGVGLNNTKAVFEAIWCAIRRKPAEFVRTPKYGVTGSTARWRQARTFTVKKLWLPILEVAFGLYMTTCIVISLWYGFGYSTIPFLMIFAGGYFYVGCSSLYVLWRMNQQAEEAAALAAAAEIVSI